MSVQLLVLAKAPVAGRVKTRLCPPCTAEQAARLAEAALRDTLDAVDDMVAADRRVLVVEGDSPLWRRPGWNVVPQRGDSLGERIRDAFVDTTVEGVPSLLVGMDTPQVTGTLMTGCARLLDRADAVLGPARDGGWWLLGLRDPGRAQVLATVPTSRHDTGARTWAALAGAGLQVVAAPMLRDVDTVDDAVAVAAQCPAGRFAAAVSRHVLAGIKAGA